MVRREEKDGKIIWTQRKTMKTVEVTDERKYSGGKKKHT